MVRNIVLTLGLSVLIAGAASAQIVPATPGGDPAPAPQPAEGGGIIPGKPPGPGAGGETENDKAFKDLLTGAWKIDIQAPPGWTAWSEVTYYADGTFAGTVVSVSPNPAPYNRSENRVAGTYAVKAVDRSNFSLTLTFTMPAGQPVSTDTLTYIDQNTLYSSRGQRNATRIQ